MSTDTSIGPGPESGGNEDHGNADGCGNKTLGDRSGQQPPAGAEPASPAAPAGPANNAAPDQPAPGR